MCRTTSLIGLVCHTEAVLVERSAYRSVGLVWLVCAVWQLDSCWTQFKVAADKRHNEHHLSNVGRGVGGQWAGQWKAVHADVLV